MIKKGLVLFITAALLLTQLPILSVGAAEGDGSAGATGEKVIFNMGFEDTDDLYSKLYNMDSGFANTKLDDQNQEVVRVANTDGSYYGSVKSAFKINGFPFFYNSDGTVDTDEAITTGKLKIHFRFKTNEGTINGVGSGNKYGTVCIGNRASYSKWPEWLSLLDIDGTTKNISALTFNNSAGTDGYLLKDSANKAAQVQENIWYTYDAVVDIDSRSLDAKVVKDGTNEEYTLKQSDIAVRPKNTVNDWPNANSMKGLMVLCSLDIDDIEVSYVYVPLTATGVSFSNGKGAESADAELYTTKVIVKFNQPISAVSEGAVKLDGIDCGIGTVSADGLSCTVDLPKRLVSGREHNLTVDPAKVTPTDIRVSAGESASFKFTPRGIFSYSQDFTNDVTIYSMGNSGLGAEVTDTTKFEQITENGNRFGRNVGADWGRRGFRFDEAGTSSGKLNVHFRFRPIESTLAEGNFGSVLIGNCDAKGNLLGLVNVQAADKVMSVVNINSIVSKNYPLQDASGNNAMAKQDAWYTYDAVVDLDTHSISATVVEDGTNTGYTRTVSNMAVRTGEWGDWPKATNFKDFAFLYPMDVDDISISTDCSPTMSKTTDKVTAQAVAQTTENALLLAQYSENGELVTVSMESAALAAGEATIVDAEAAWANGAVKAKAFLWDGLENLTPLENCAEITR